VYCYGQAPVTSLEGLEYAPNLASLAINGDAFSSGGDVPIASLTPLSGNTNLTSLNLHDTHISDFTGLSTLTGLQTLDLYYTTLPNLNAVSGLTNLTYLVTGGNGISDISGLSGLTSLQTLVVSNSGISDISVLSHMPNLSYFDMGGNAVSNLAPLSGLAHLHSLYAESNHITDIAPLVANPALGSGATVTVQDNYLDLTPGSVAMSEINALLGRNVNLTYTPQSPLPVASSSLLITNVGTPLAVTMSASGGANPLSYSVLTGPSHGTLGAISGNQVTYTPAPGFTGADSFTFKVNDGRLDSNVATVFIDVTSAAAGAPFSNEYPPPESVLTSNPVVVSVDLIGVPRLDANTAKITIGGVVCNAVVIQQGGSLGTWTNTGYTQDANGFWVAHWSWSSSTDANATLWVYPPSSVLANGALTATATVTDVAGTTYTGSWTCGVAAAPVLGAPTPAAGVTVNTPTPTISIPVFFNGAVGTASAMVNGTAASATVSNGIIHVTGFGTLSNGPSTVSVIASAAVGGTATKGWSFTVIIPSP